MSECEAVEELGLSLIRTGVFGGGVSPERPNLERVETGSLTPEINQGTVETLSPGFRVHPPPPTGLVLYARSSSTPYRGVFSLSLRPYQFGVFGRKGPVK